MALVGRTTPEVVTEHDATVQTYRLMRKNIEVAEFRWDPRANKVLKPCRAISMESMPFGCLSSGGTFNSESLSIWLKERSIPASRPDVMERLHNLGIANTTELLSISLGLSLSDQYWVRPCDSDLRWEEVNHFTNGFSSLLGELLLPHDRDSLPELERAASSSHSLLGDSPDAALNGNLPKAWVNVDGATLLRKAGRAENRYQEPFNEVIATELYRRMLDRGEFVPYELQVDGYLKYFSLCPCMVDEDTEFVPAIQLYRSHQKANHEGMCDFYTRILREHGLDPDRSLEKMLTLDFLIANFDRHWNNFGVLIDSDGRNFLGCAPIFDSGEALWCNRDMHRRFDGYRFDKSDQIRPFSRDLDQHLTRFCNDLSWFDPSPLCDFDQVIQGALSLNPLVGMEPGRIDKIVESVHGRIETVSKRALELNPVYPGMDLDEGFDELLEVKRVESSACSELRGPVAENTQDR